MVQCDIMDRKLHKSNLSAELIRNPAAGWQNFGRCIWSGECLSGGGIRRRASKNADEKNEKNEKTRKRNKKGICRVYIDGSPCYIAGK